MKRKTVVFVVAVAALLLVAPATLSAMPRNVLANMIAAQDSGLVVGAGLSDARHIPTARSIATMEARADIARELQVVVSTWQELETAAVQVIGQTGRCEWTEVLFGAITETVARATFPGSRVIYEYREANGLYWVVMTISRDVAESAVSSAAVNAETAAAASPDVQQPSHIERGRMAADDALERMRAAFDLHFGW